LHHDRLDYNPTHLPPYLLTWYDSVGPTPLRHQCANSDTPWHTVMCFADNDLRASVPLCQRVTTLEKNWPVGGIYSHQTAIQFVKMAEGRCCNLWRLPNSGVASMQAPEPLSAKTHARSC
jgi:hypothetical protein